MVQNEINNLSFLTGDNKTKMSKVGLKSTDFYSNQLFTLLSLEHCHRRMTDILQSHLDLAHYTRDKNTVNILCHVNTVYLRTCAGMLTGKVHLIILGELLVNMHKHGTCHENIPIVKNLLLAFVLSCSACMCMYLCFLQN